MKIAILTLNTHNNYGNRLQNYALQEVLRKYADVVDTIWYEEDTYILNRKIWNNKLALKYILNWKDSKEYIRKYYIYECIREYNIKKFSDRYLSIKYDFKIKDKLDKEYDYFIIGSDQVWNSSIWRLSKNPGDRFLEFANKEKRISYAASFGIDKISEKDKDIYIKGLQGMKYISVREKTGANLVKKLIGKMPSVNIDPAMLLSRKDWEKIAKKPDWYKGENYILTYFLWGNNNYKNLNNIIRNLVEKKGWKVYNLLDKNVLDVYSSRVEEFIYLIKNAKLVCADSFHATVFSIIFNTPFFVLTHKGSEKVSSRLEDLLELFNFKDRFLNQEKDELLSINNIFNMSFSNVEEIIEKEKLKSIDFLECALNIKNEKE